MRERRGRLNSTGFIDEKIMYKIAVVKEKKKPFRLEIEKWALVQARDIGINVPRVIDYYLNDSGQEVLVLERVNGSNIYHLSSQEKINYMFSVGCQMMVLSIRSKKFGWIDPISKEGAYSSWRDFLFDYVEDYGGRIVDRHIISKRELKCLISALDILNLDVETPHLVHRDIKPGNILIDADRKTWIVDWENVILGDPLYDLAVFGGNYGHGVLWSGLAGGYRVDVVPEKYHLYRAISLLGTVDFCIKHKTPYLKKEERLKKIIGNFLRK